MAQKEMSLKDISYLELWQPLCSVDRTNLCNFNRRHHEKQFFEIILNLDQWFKRKCRLKVFLIWSSGSPFVQRSVTICAILVEGLFVLFDLILYVPSTIFQLNRDGSSLVEPALS